METVNKNKNTGGGIYSFEFSSYVAPKIEPAIGTKWTLNGVNNEFFYTIKDCYNGSTTNASIINAFTNYIFADGIIDDKGANISKYVSRKDLKLMVLDYKTYGSFSMQVIWNRADKNEDKKPVRIKHISPLKVGLNINDRNIVDGYWYSFDWRDQSKYKPVYFPKFDGQYKVNEEGVGYDVELLVVNRTSTEPFFPNPDYIPALQYAQMEMELANSGINHIKNGFSATKVVNVPFKPETEELEEEYAEDIKRNTTGSSNTNSVIIAFNENPEYKVTVDPIEVTELNAQYQHFEEIAEQKIVVGHSAPPVLFSGTREGGGLGNNSEEIKTATEMLYQKHINPMREDILDGLNDVFKFIDSAVSLRFKDFGEKENGEEDVVVDTRTIDSQAALKGSVGGVQAVLSIQASVVAGTTSFSSAVAMLETIFGFTNEQAIEIIGNPEKPVQ